MHVLRICCLLLLVVETDGKSIPFIENVYLRSFDEVNLNVQITRNRTCTQCLCDLLDSNNGTSYVALNCFTNMTCQFFQTFPITYTLQAFSEAKLYFLQSIFPNSSKCCMPNFNELLARLQNSTPIITNLTFLPATFGYDETKPNTTALLGRYGTLVYWFNPFNLTLFSNTFVQNASLSLALHNGSMFTGIDQVPAAYVFNIQTGNLTTTIGHPTLSKVRKYIFINDGQTMVATAQNNQSLAFFNVNSPTNYTFQQSVPFPFSTVHGLAKVNDTFLYAGSYTTRTIVSYNYQNLTWNYRTFASAAGNGSGSHIAVDDCGRVWFIVNSFGLHIYNPSGVEIGNWTMATSSSTIFDLLFLPNYVLLITRKEDQKIVRYDPQITCS